MDAQEESVLGWYLNSLYNFKTVALSHEVTTGRPVEKIDTSSPTVPQRRP